MTNQITFTINATPDNADTISAITALLTGIAPKKSETKETSKATKETKETETDSVVEETDITLTDFKKAAKAVKTNFSEEFALSIIEMTGTKPGSTLGRTLSKVPSEDYATIIAAWEEGPQNDDDDDLADDDLADDDLADVDADAVKLALKAYSKSEGRPEAKALMAKFECNSLADVDNLSSSELAQLMEATIL